MEKSSECKGSGSNLLKNSIVDLLDGRRSRTNNFDINYSEGADGWLPIGLNNNNHTIGGPATKEEKSNKEGLKKQENTQQKVWNCGNCEASAINVGVSLSSYNYTMNALDDVEDEGGGASSAVNSIKIHNVSDTDTPIQKSCYTQGMSTSTAVTMSQSHESNLYEIDNTMEIGAFAVDGAGSLTPPGISHSNRTSVNNSTENLSYTSDNCYPDDLILLEDDDMEAEEISLNFDNCFYAYRGDGADIDLAIDAGAGRGVDDGQLDDETDFLEMDFDPDPLSEVECGSAEVDPDIDAFLIQRDACHLSGRHSATNMEMNNSSRVSRPLFSSPINDLPTPKGLQAQALLSKDYARINLHLDQIKGESGDGDKFASARNGTVPIMMLTNDTEANDLTSKTAHSLPNTLQHTSFNLKSMEAEETKISPSKITGAKPKRLSTFSTSSSISSKNSSKSRTSLRSSFAPTLCGSSSFDERSVSCTEFRSVTGPEDCMSMNKINNVCDDIGGNDETCLDCLEKEFLANTIGKAIDFNKCPKCRKRNGSSSFLTHRNMHQPRCRSGSPSFFNDIGDEYIFSSSNDFMTNNRHRPDEWATFAQSHANPNPCLSKHSKLCETKSSGVMSLNSSDIGNQRMANCDTFSGELLLKQVMRTEEEIVTISYLNLSEETLVQALDKLFIPFNRDLIRTYFTDSPTTANINKPAMHFESLKDFILYESKKNCNHPKLKHLIELATCQQVNVQVKKDTNIKNSSTTTVKMTDILQQWAHFKSLASLKQLDKRFVEFNILGKIAYCVRQAQLRVIPSRPLPEYLTIPQYYENGYLVMTRKC